MAGHEQVCVQLPTSAVSVALPAFVAVRRSSDCCGAGRVAEYLLPGGHTAANPPQAAAVGEWDRQSDAQTMLAYCASSANNRSWFSVFTSPGQPQLTDSMNDVARLTQ